MKIKVDFRKIVSVIATTAVIFNSVAPTLTVLAQELPSPTPSDTSTPAPDATIAPSDNPTATPDATPIETASPAPEVTSTPTDFVTPTPSETPVVTQAPESNQTVQGPPSSNEPSTQTSSAPTTTPTATPKAPTEHGTLTETVIDNIDLSGVNSLNSNVADSGVITTDKPDYSPTSMVLISGSGFIANKTYTIEIVSTDQPPVNFTDSVKADSSGNISYAYQLDGNYRPNYTAYIKSGAVIVATVTFTDTSLKKDFSQCANSDSPTPTGQCHWIGSALQNTNSDYGEGMTVPQRIVFTDIPSTSGNVHTLTFSHQATKGGIHAYDFLTAYNQSDNPALILNSCNDLGGLAGACTTLHASSNTSNVDVPDDPFISKDGSTQNRINSYESVYGNRQIKIYANSVISGAVLTITSHSVSNGGDTSDSEINYSLTWTSSSADILIEMAGHLSVGGNGTGYTWGAGLGSASVSGGPYHFKLNQLDGAAIGSQDNQIQTGAIVLPGNIIINKNTVSADGTFSYSTTGGSTVPATFSITTSGNTGSQTFNNALAGTYTITEDLPSAGFSLTNLTCSDPSNNSGVNTVSREATVVLGAGETVTCTFTNTFSKGSPTISTTPNPSSGIVGVTLNDSATLSGGNNPTGSVTFKLFSPSDSSCTGTPTYTETDSVAPYATSTGFASNAVGTWHWAASYSGDSNNNTAFSSCSEEAVTIRQATPTVSTVASSGGEVGTLIHDMANISGGFSPTGTITFNLYDVGDNSCSKTPVYTDSNKTLSGGSATSGDFTTTSAGTYHWRATYNGDNNNISVTSGCSEEPVVITAVNPTLSTLLSSSTINVGDYVNDSAILSGATSNASGTVTYSVFTDDQCTLDAQSAGIKTVTNGVVDNSNSIQFNNAGDYYWQAEYSGDSNNNSAVSTCTKEHLLVNKATPSLTTNASGPVIIGQAIHDIAHLSGGFGSLSGNITFDVFAPNDINCNAPISVTPSQTVSGVGDYTSGDYITNLLGTYRWIAHYSGNTNNNKVDTLCNDANESSTVNLASPTISTLQSAGGVLGTSLTDTATLTGGFNLTGSIIFSLYGPSKSNCTGGADFTNTVTVNGEGNYSTSSGFQAFIAGVWRWVASYTGDLNNNGVSGACNDEQVTIEKANPEVTTEIHDSGEGIVTSETQDLNVHDSATVSGVENGPIPTGTISFEFYTGSKCSSLRPQDAGTIALDSQGYAHPSSNINLTQAGSYSFLAHYSGDSNYNPADGPCEAFTLSTLQIVKNAVGGDATFNFTNSQGGTPINKNVTTVNGVGQTNIIPVVSGDYSLSENVPNGWELTSSNCGVEASTSSFTVNAGQGVTCTFTNEKYGSMQGRKYIDANMDGRLETNESFLDGWTVRLYDSNWHYKSSYVTGTGGLLTGQYKFDNLLPGRYYTCEVQKNGYAQTAPLLGAHAVDYNNSQVNGSSAVDNGSNQSDEASICWQSDVNGDAMQWLGFGNIHYGNIIVKKITNTNTEDRFEFSSNFTKDNFYLNSGDEFDSGNLLPGGYSVSELTDSGWNLTSATCDNEDSPNNISLSAGDTVTCTFENSQVIPSISLEKSNDSPNTTAGSTVTYKLIVHNTGTVTLNSVVVNDFIPGGFSYVVGSTVGASEPSVSGSVLTWDIGTLAADASVTFTYQVKLASNLTDGIYTNFATCTSRYGGFENLFTTAEINNEGGELVECKQVNSTVTLGSGQSYGGNLQGQVLGASTELPATGSPTALLALALGVLGVGIGLSIYNSRKQNKYHAKN